MSLESRLGRPPLLLTRLAMFVALGLVAGLALSGIPNVELVTAICFIAGFMLGPSAGLLTGGLTEALFAGFNPNGSSIGLMLVAQVIGMALAGLAGALAAFFLRGLRKGAVYATAIVGLGALATLIFDFLTNLAFPVMAGFSVSELWITMIAGVPFALTHLISNVLVFLIVVVPFVPRLERAMKIT
jgi:energy-coupling factor transport system substrate-specific component